MPPLLVDECCRKRLIEALREQGLDVAAVWEIARSAKDPEVLRLAVAEQRILVTDDKDFGELVVKDQLPFVGVILMRTSTDDGDVQARLILDVLRSDPKLVDGAIVVIEDHRFRRRELRPAP